MEVNGRAPSSGLVGTKVVGWKVCGTRWVSFHPLPSSKAGRGLDGHDGNPKLRPGGAEGSRARLRRLKRHRRHLQLLLSRCKTDCTKVTNKRI